MPPRNRPQIHHRTAESACAHESSGGAFTAVLRANAAGFVVDYPGLWREERASPA